MKYITFILFAVMIITLAVATIVEKFFGTQFVHSAIYGASWFYIFWGVLTIVALLYMHRSKLQKKLSTYLLHISFVLILLGAITTALSSTRGAFYLPVGVERNDFTDENGSVTQFPFNIKLNSFDVQYYAGTNAPADYVSHIIITEDDGSESELLVSMNSIGRYKGYRFYQSDYDKEGSWLTVNRDIYGIPITYTAYILLALSLIFLLLDSKGAFRQLLRSPFLRNSSVIITLFCSLLIPSTISAANGDIPKTITAEYAKSLDQLQVVYNNRVMPVSTLSRNFTMKISGDSKYRNLSSSQFFWSWLFFPTEWEKVPMFEVPQSDKSRFLKLNEVAAYRDFFTEKGVYKLNHYMRNTDPQTQPALYKELVKLNEKVQLVAMLRSGAMVKLFPYSYDNNIVWYSPSDTLPEDMDRGQSLFIKNSFQMLLSAYDAHDDDLFADLVSKFVAYQNKYGGESLILPSKFRAEQLYYRFHVTTILYRSTLTIGILVLLLLMLAKNNKRLQRLAFRLLVVNIVHAICFLMFHIGLKWYITGKLPLMNGYDTMVFLGFSIAIITFIIRKSYPLFTALSSMLVGFTMLVATIGGLNPQITPLVPVLNSPFLTTHVCCIMLAYALFAFTFINGVLALTVGRNNLELSNRLTVYSKLFLFVGIAFIAIGIFIGAVWANVSWGRYWAWDPKEVWALITMMVYCLPLHNRSLKFFNNTTFFHAYLVCAIVVVLMTYFGVNLVLGGMHSYVNG